ncbi:MAG TPA: HEAT repeat domain-containing protein [Planctomycetota bacterium]|nr:HEAT repeat domain-containing protein [Planctomycetota bacterium]
MGYEQDDKDRVEHLWTRLSPEAVAACEREILRLGGEALKLCLTFPEPLLFARTRHWLVDIALRMPRDEALPVLLEALSHPAWQIYQIARDAIAKLGVEVKDALVANLRKGTVPGGRIQTLWCLHRLADPFGPLALGDRSLVAPIAEVAASDPAPEVRAYAVTALSRSEAGEAGDVIAKALEDASEEVRLAAMRAAGRLRLRACVPALLKMLDHDDAEVRADVVYALDRIGDVSAAPAVRERLTDESFYVRWAAVGALESLWEDANVGALEAAARDENPVVAKAAAETLARRSSTRSSG